MNVNLELSQNLSKAVGAKAKQCFTNAYHGIQDHYPDAFYVEGIAIPRHGDGLGAPVEHAWLEINGEIVDPTFCDRSLPIPKRAQWGGVKRSAPTLAEAYFPVLRLTRSEVDQTVVKIGEIHSVWETHFMYFWFDPDIFTDAQREAYKAAWQAAEKAVKP